MMDLATIKHLSSQAARKAQRQKKSPLVLAEPEDADSLGDPGYQIPNLGDYRPKGWKMIEHWLCDKSGMGAEYEPALTIRQLKERIKDNITEGKIYGYGMIEEGQFQVVLGVFEKTKR